MTDYKGKVIDTCSDCGKRGPMWSGMPYKCKGCSDKMSKSNDVFQKAWNIVKEDKVPEQLEGEDWDDYVDRIYQNHKYGDDPLNLQGTTKCPCRQGFHPCDDPKCIEAHESSPNSKGYRGN